MASKTEAPSVDDEERGYQSPAVVSAADKLKHYRRINVALTFLYLAIVFGCIVFFLFVFALINVFSRSVDRQVSMLPSNCTKAPSFGQLHVTPSGNEQLLNNSTLIRNLGTAYYPESPRVSV